MLAVFQTPSGQIKLTMMTTTGRIPTCLNIGQLPTMTASGSLVYETAKFAASPAETVNSSVS